MLRPTYPIETARLRLRPFTLDDLDALHAIQSRPDVARYLYWGPRSRDEVYHQRLGCGARAPIGDALDDTYDRASATGVAGALGFTSSACSTGRVRSPRASDTRRSSKTPTSSSRPPIASR